MIGVLKDPNKSGSIYMEPLALSNFIFFHPHHVSKLTLKLYSTFYQTLSITK